MSLVVIALAIAVSHGAGAQGLAQPACPDAPEPLIFVDGLDRLENLVFDGQGHLYVTSIDGNLRRFSPDGSMELLVEVDTQLAGLAWSPAGELYMGLGAGIDTPVEVPSELGIPLIGPTSGTSEVWRFTSLFPPEHDVYVAGLNGANGMAFDPAGNLYISEGFDEGIMRVPPNGAAQLWTTAGSPNGLHLSPDSTALYAALSFDPRSSVLSISLADPNDRTTLVELSPPGEAFWQGLDDLAVAPDGVVYVTGHMSGELLRADPASGEVCVLASGFDATSAVRIAEGFGAYDGALFVTDFSGAITVLPLDPGPSAVGPAHVDDGSVGPSRVPLGPATVMVAIAIAIAIAIAAAAAVGPMSRRGAKGWS